MDDIKLFNDEELVLLFKKGNERAFEELYNRYSTRLKRLIYYYISQGDAVHDIFQEVFLRVVRHIDTFDVAMNFSSWVYQIAVNCSKNYLKKNMKDTALIEKEKFRVVDREQSQMTPEEGLLAQYDIKAFNEAVDTLKDKFKDVFILRYDHGMKYQEISRVLDISERTAKWRMKLAVETIALYLKEKGII